MTREAAGLISERVRLGKRIGDPSESRPDYAQEATVVRALAMAGAAEWPIYIRAHPDCART
jgi:hypothetical protein